MAVRKKAASSSRKAAKKSSHVNAVVNGTNTGVIEPGTLSIGQAANNLAKEHGLKAFTILIDGVKVNVEDAAKPLAGHSSMEVFAKETRG